MKRDVFSSFLAWKEKKDRKPLVLMGARQVGKTWLMRDFGKRNFAQVHEFNFDGSADLASVFVNTKKPDDLLRKLSIIGGVKINPTEDLVIFDEIQECADALNSRVKEKCPRWAIRFSRRNLKRDGGFVNIPLYLVERFADCLVR